MIGYYRVLKAVVNAAINGLTSVLDAPNRVVLSPLLRPLLERISVEAEAAVGAAGFSVEREYILSTILGVARATADNISSTLSDLRRCARTEAPWIYEPLISLARRGGVEPVTLETLYILVRTLEEGGLRCRGRRSPRGASPG